MTEAVSGPSLKDMNHPTLLAVVVLNFAVLWIIQRSGSLWAGDWIAVAAGWLSALPAGIGAALIAVLNSQVSATTKARAVFWRWRHPLPGSEAFTRYGRGDERIDMQALERKFGPLPFEPKDQNVLWYSLYRRVANDPAVLQIHRHFLFARDYTFIAALMLPIFGTAAFTAMRPRSIAAIYFLLLIAQWALATNAARKNGCRFVTTVLAQNGAGT